MTLNKRRGALPAGAAVVTAYLNVRYLKAVGTPQTVLVVVRCREVRGRKWYVDAEVRDGEGGVLAKAESLWVRLLESRMSSWARGLRVWDWQRSGKSVL